MTIRQRFYLTLAYAAFVIFLNSIAHAFYLYWNYRWVDIPMHILGGIMAGLFSLIFIRAIRMPETFVNALTGVLLVGLGWEVLELLYKVDVVNFAYWTDTVHDLINDLLGGLIAIYIWRKIPNQRLRN